MELVNDAIIQEQLLVRAIGSSYVGKEVVGNNVTTLFPDSLAYQMIAQAIGLHYNQTEDDITEKGLKVSLEKQYRANERLNRKQPDLLELYNLSNKLLSTEEDNSADVVSQLNNYVRSKISLEKILSAVKAHTINPDFDVPTAVQKEMDKINSIDVTGSGDAVISVYEDFDKKEKAYEGLREDVVPSGIPSLDEATSGGLAKGEVAMIGALSGNGKTTFLSNLSVAYARTGCHVFYAALEEKDSRMMLRFDKITLGVGTGRIFKDNKLDKKMFEGSRKVYNELHKAGKLGDIYFHADKPSTLTIDRLKQIVQSYCRSRGCKIDVLVIDYPDLLKNPNETGNISFDGGRLFQQVKALAQSLNVVVWTATQLNRMSFSQDVLTLSSIEGSYQKINILDFACTYNRTKEEYLQGYFRLHLDKIRNRDNYSGDTLFFKFDNVSTRICEESPAEKDEHLAILSQESIDLKNERRDAANYVDKNQKRINEKQEKANKFNDRFV